MRPDRTSVEPNLDPNFFYIYGIHERIFYLF